MECVSNRWGVMPVMVVITTALLGGCPQTIDIRTLELGVETSGTLAGGRTVEYTFDVESGHHYAASVTGSAGTLGLADLRLTVSGDPLGGDEEASVFGLFRPEAITSFYAGAAGPVRLSVRNRTEGLSVGGGLLDLLVGDLSQANYRVLVRDLGLDDHGQDPQNPTTLSSDGSALLGALVAPEDQDFFALPVVAGRSYELKLESVSDVRLAAGEIDRFDAFVLTLGGQVQFQIRSERGLPGVARFAATEAATVLMGLQAGPGSLLAGLLGVPPGLDSFPIQYAITVTEEATAP